MSLKEPVLKIVNKEYEPLTMVERTVGRNNLMFKTDEAGRPVLLFIGKKDANGHIMGDRYSRRLKFDESGNLIKDHWERKGEAT
ncbi:hypothetical protein [Sphingobacterium haloxyli]|uniref:Uncharacterized protein n=1 Tax=Sphingobacterium haloxyli TaxID=2100533 RepID=A0A2S9J5R1_9SPHI|nr:hypothetical protein [Sphingobacterium haloxyli]PRD48090.1 hypothetical protein C5745_06135 [Sphingobacterium haloxyli]